MPHLSPLNWILVPIMMILILMFLSSLMWWQFTPQFPSQGPLQSHVNYLKWKW